MKRQLIFSLTIGAVCASCLLALGTCVNVASADKIVMTLAPPTTPQIIDPPDPMYYKQFLPTINKGDKPQ